MIIADLPCLAIAADGDEVIGGKQNDDYDNKGAAVALAYADGSEALAAAGTSVYIDRGVSKVQGFSQAESLN
jgi:limonene-1,2-epoxide hydrolase